MESKPPESHPSEQALVLAYRHLNRRERTVGEMRAHLATRGVEDEAAEDAIETLVEQGYLDDARFARIFAQDKRELERWGAERIRQALLARGVERDLVEAALDDDPSAWPDAHAGDCDAPHGAGNGELERALTLLRGRFAVPPRDRRERDRALGVLLRKGYDSEVALEALASYAREG